MSKASRKAALSIAPVTAGVAPERAEPRVPTPEVGDGAQSLSLSFEGHESPVLIITSEVVHEGLSVVGQGLPNLSVVEADDRIQPLSSQGAIRSGAQRSYSPPHDGHGAPLVRANSSLEDGGIASSPSSGTPPLLLDEYDSDFDST